MRHTRAMHPGRISQASLLLNRRGSGDSDPIVTTRTDRDSLHARAIILAAHALQLSLFLAACSFLSACGHNASISEGGDVTGVYLLTSVNGGQVPTRVDHDGTALEVRSGTFTVNADGTCATKTVFLPPSGTEVAREVSATYTKSGSKLTMQWEGAGTTIGTVEGDTLTMQNEGMVFVYRK